MKERRAAEWKRLTVPERDAITVISAMSKVRCDDGIFIIFFIIIIIMVYSRSGWWTEAVMKITMIQNDDYDFLFYFLHNCVVNPIFFLMNF